MQKTVVNILAFCETCEDTSRRYAGHELVACSSPSFINEGNARVSMVATCLLPVNWVALLHSFDHSTSSFNSAIVVPATSFSSRFAGFSTPRQPESADWFLSRADLVKFHRQSVLSILPSPPPLGRDPRTRSRFACVLYNLAFVLLSFIRNVYRISRRSTLLLHYCTMYASAACYALRRYIYLQRQAQ